MLKYLQDNEILLKDKAKDDFFNQMKKLLIKQGK